MKTFIALTLFNLISVFTLGQVGLNGINLGTQGVNEKRVMGTVSEIPGVITTLALNDGRICSIKFDPGTEEGGSKTISRSDLDKLLTGLEASFNVKFEFMPKDTDNKDGSYLAFFKKDERFYAIMVVVEVDDNLEPLIEAKLSLDDTELSVIHGNEGQH
jgi:hypothetical protein